MAGVTWMCGHVWLVVVIVVMSAFTLAGWFRFIDHDGRVLRKPRYVELPEDDEEP